MCVYAPTDRIERVSFLSSWYSSLINGGVKFWSFSKDFNTVMNLEESRECMDLGRLQRSLLIWSSFGASRLAFSWVRVYFFRKWVGWCKK